MPTRQKQLGSSRAPEQVSNLSTKDIILNYLLNSGQDVSNPNWPRYTGPMADYLNPEANPMSDTPSSPNLGMVINRRNLPRMLETWNENARQRPMTDLLGNLANPENVAAQSWLETVAPRFARQLDMYEVPKSLPQFSTKHRVEPISPGGLEPFYEWLQTLKTPEQRAIVKSATERLNQVPIGTISPESDEIIETIGGLTDAQAWERIRRQSELAQRIPPHVFKTVENLRDAARNKFMRFLDLLVEEKGPSEASEILTNIGKRSE